MDNKLLIILPYLACFLGCSDSYNEPIKKPSDAIITFALDDAWTDIQKLSIKEASLAWIDLGAEITFDSSSLNRITIDNTIGAAAITTLGIESTPITINLAHIQWFCWAEINPIWYLSCLRDVSIHEMGHAIKIGGPDIDALGHINEQFDVMCGPIDCYLYCTEVDCDQPKNLQLTEKDKKAYWSAYPNSQGLSKGN